ncbi:MAG: hypothetical protein WC437_05755 [Patescibacteria group bacterium]
MFKDPKKIVILLGAGSTKANADDVPDCEKPPLNSKFFANTRTSIEQSDSDHKERKCQLENIRIYFEKRHRVDIFSESEDFLEKIMSTLFFDVKNSKLMTESYHVFRILLTLIHERIGETTNNITINERKPLYHLVDYFFQRGIHPENLTIITFNYDIYIEKTLAAMALSRNVARYFSDPDQTIFSLQYGYASDFGLPTRPPRPRQGYFPISPDIKKGGIRVLKLHGSLNWYSYYPTEEITLTDMFKRDRPIKVSREKEINSTQLKYRDPDGLIKYTLPIIVPPVENKEEIYHSKILDLWDFAREALISADEIIIYGYSCPHSDVDSRNLLYSSLEINPKKQGISIIDRDSSIKNHYQKLLPSKEICDPYVDVSQYLESNV